MQTRPRRSPMKQMQEQHHGRLRERRKFPLAILATLRRSQSASLATFRWLPSPEQELGQQPRQERAKIQKKLGRESRELRLGQVNLLARFVSATILVARVALPLRSSTT